MSMKNMDYSVAILNIIQLQIEFLSMEEVL